MDSKAGDGTAEEAIQMIHDYGNAAGTYRGTQVTPNPELPITTSRIHEVKELIETLIHRPFERSSQHLPKHHSTQHHEENLVLSVLKDVLHRFKAVILRIFLVV
ncbi:hypothetical protein AAES_141231 [Amazona aestiva]|uniref:Uncharacterized protein n=1 Tax=Amazona aestiva TaxID=12930 RepID=A0A0Q3UQW8_AMAAE|nr:hypothetical protein AAES_141231 [Amazona aestiva]